MSVLLIAAHPDDETFAGGLVSRLAAEKHDVFFVLTTRGEGGSVGVPPLCAQNELGAVREQESRRSAAVLGVRETFFLPYVDPLVGEGDRLFPIDVPLATFSAVIQTYLERLRPDIVLTHGQNGEYGHPQHVYTHQAVFMALKQLQPWRPDRVLTWNAAYPDPELENQINHDDPADWILDVTPWSDKKMAAYAEFHTQHHVLSLAHPGRPLSIFPERIESYRLWTEFSRQASL